MSLTSINKSNITPHLRKFIDDIISMTSSIVLKRVDIAESYENSTSVILSEYYKEILEGTDTLNSYDKIPYEAYASMMSWQKVGLENIDDFPSIINFTEFLESGESIVSMKNKINTCYVGIDDPSIDDSYKEVGNIYDGYIQIDKELSTIKKLKTYRKIGSMYILVDESSIDWTNSDTDESKINLNQVYTQVDDNSEFILLDNLNNRYDLVNDKYILSNSGLYYYDVVYNLFMRLQVFDDYQINDIMNNNVLVPNEYRGDLLNAMRNYVKNVYIRPNLSPSKDFKITRYFGENNTYYRLLNGLPAANRMSSQPDILMDDLIPEIYKGTNTIKKLYNLTDEEIETIKNNGKYDELFDIYSSIEYVRHMGKNRIDVITARNADKFDILAIGPYEDQSHYDIFIKNFNTAREYILRRFYNPEIFYTHEYYGSYIAYLIVSQAMCQSIAHSDSILLNYLYTDEETVRLRLQSYGLNVFDDIPLIYRKNIAKYIERLIYNKGTDSIYPFITDLFGMDDVEVYRYFYRRTKDEDGNIKLSMAQVPIGTENFINEIIKDINMVSYENITENDIYWASYGIPIKLKNEMTGKFEEVVDPDEYLKNTITNIPFNYMNSKYISINAIFNLSKLNFNASYLMNYLLELSKRNLNIITAVDGLNERQSLFMLIVALFAIQAKRLNYDGNIQHDLVSVAYVLKYNLDGYILKNGEEIKIIDLYKKYYNEYYYKYLIERDPNTNKIINNIESLIQLGNNTNDLINEEKQRVDNLSDKEKEKLVSLEIPEDISISSISESYLFNSGLDGAYDNIMKLREEAKSYKEYECYDQLLKAIAISKMNNSIFELSNPEWIEIDDSIAWVEIRDETIKRRVFNDYINNIESDDYTLCKSTGCPDLSLGYEYSVIKPQYCIDRLTIIDNEYNSSIKVYMKNYITTGFNTALVGNNILYVVEKINIEEAFSNIDLSIYDNPYCYNKTTNKLYKYLKYARTYQEYLQYENSYLYKLIQPTLGDYNTDSNSSYLSKTYYDRLDELYVNIILAIENMIKNDTLKKAINSSLIDLNLLTKYIKKVITVFKSFEIDIATVNIIYEINDPYNYRVKIVDDLSSESVDNIYTHFHLMQDFCVDETSTFDNDSITIRDELNIEENNGGN